MVQGETYEIHLTRCPDRNFTILHVGDKLRAVGEPHIRPVIIRFEPEGIVCDVETCLPTHQVTRTLFDPDQVVLWERAS